jgi:UDP-2,4-diacetamido-2,4,6-trideoxy-beta-L-altropyranose hydrolase
MNDIRVLFRAEASNTLGLGHLMRCIALASSMPASWARTLVIKAQPPESVRTIIPEDWHVVSLPVDVRPEEDARLTADAATRMNANIVVTDLCHQDMLKESNALAAYHGQLRANMAAKLISIGDCRVPRYASDLAIVPYDCPGPAGFDQNERILTGLNYYICRPEFTEAAAAYREIAGEGRRILVCIGGSDPLGATAMVAKALAGEGFDGIEARLIVGAGASEGLFAEVEEICCGREGLSVCRHAENISADLSWADLAVLGEGLTKFEAALVGTPSLIISQFDHDSEVVRRFYAYGTAKYAGPVDELTVPDLAREILTLLGDTGARRTQSLAGRKLLDGHGAQRIVAEMQKLTNEATA